MNNIKMSNCSVKNISIDSVSPISIINHGSTLSTMNIYMDYIGMNSKIVALDGDFGDMALKVSSPIVLQGNMNFSINNNINVDINNENSSLVIYGNFRTVPGIDINSSCRLINDLNSSIGDIAIHVKKEDAKFYIGRDFVNSDIIIEKPAQVTIATDVKRVIINEGLEKAATIVLSEENSPQFKQVEINSPTVISGIRNDISSFNNAIISGKEMLNIDKQGTESKATEGNTETIALRYNKVGNYILEGFIKVGEDFISIGNINIVIEG